MSVNRELLTQGELTALTEELTTLLGNVTEHANAPLDTAHGINAVVASTQGGYFDSGGDRLTAAPSSADNNLLLRVSTSPSHGVFYVPAILAEAGDVPVRADTPAVDKSTSGLPPLDRTLVTEYTSLLEAEALIHNAVLFEHTKTITSATTGKPVAHSGVTSAILGNDARDTLGHRLGRNTVSFYIGGKRYRVPCDVRRQGPPQSARKVVGGDPAPYGRNFAPAESGFGGVSATFQALGEHPVSFRWRACATEAGLNGIAARVFSAATGIVVDSDGFFYATSNSNSASGAEAGASGAGWAYLTLGMLQQPSSGVGTASCTISSGGIQAGGGYGEYESNHEYYNDLVLQCDAKGAGSDDIVTSTLVYWSFYDDTDKLF